MTGVTSVLGSRLRARVRGVTQTAVIPVTRHSDATTAEPSRAHARTREAPAVSRLALGVDEAALALGVSRDFFEEHIAHELRWVRRGRRKLVAVKELERWLEESAARTLEVA